MSNQHKNKLPPFVALTWELLNSKAYKELPPTAAKMLPYFLGKVKIPLGNSQYYTLTFSFSYSEGVSLGAAKKTFYNVLCALVAYGFIEPIEKGGLRGCGLTSSTFKLSDRWKKYGTAFYLSKSFSEHGQNQIERIVKV